MNEILKSLKTHIMFSSVLCILLGLSFIIWPLKITSIICRIMALLFLILGAESLTRFLKQKAGTFTCIIGSLEIIFGIWVFVKPQSIQELIPIIIGFVLLLHGIQNAAMAWNVKETGNARWWFGMLCAVCNIIFALILICNAIGVVKIGMIFIGIMLIYDGISNIIVTVRASNVMKEIDQEENIIDTTWRE